MSTARQVLNTYEDYLRIEERGGTKHEYLAGEIYAMAGGTPEHAALASRALVLLSAALRGCTVLNSDLRVHVQASGLTTYPDVSVVCGPIERAGIDRSAVCNPSVLVEVTSPSTESYDRGDKLRHYQRIESLQAVVFVSHRLRQVTVVERSGSGWKTSDFDAGDFATLAIHDAKLSVDELYSVLNGL